MPSDQDIRGQQRLLAAHRATLRHRLNQLAIHGEGDVPPVVIYEIAHARGEIKRIKATLDRWGATYEDLPEDEESPDAIDSTPRAMRHASGTVNNFYGPITAGSAQFGGSQHIEEAKITMGDTFDFSGANISNSNINVKAKLDNVIQTVGAMASGDEAARQQLEQLLQQLSAELQKAPAGHADDAEAVAETAKGLVETASKAKPNKALVNISAEGLKQAAANVAAVLPAVLPIATQIVQHIQSLIR